MRDSDALNRNISPRLTVPQGRVRIGQVEGQKVTPDSALGSLKLRSEGPSTNSLLLRAWRSLTNLRIDDALASLAQFEDEIARAECRVAPRSRDIAEGLRA